MPTYARWVVLLFAKMFRKINKYDIILIVSVLLAAILLFAVISFGTKKGGYAVVTVDGETFGEFSLEKDCEIRIGNEENGNTLVIKNGSAKIEHATCPDKLCERQGAIRYDKQTIVCLPNKTVVTVKSDNAASNDFVQ